MATLIVGVRKSAWLPGRLGSRTCEPKTAMESNSRHPSEPGIGDGGRQNDAGVEFAALVQMQD